jgi:hypothetical protein
MTPASQLHVVRLRSGDLVRVRQVRPGDASAVVSAYAHLGERSRYRRFFAVVPELPEATVKAAVEVDHTDHEALVAGPSASCCSLTIEGPCPVSTVHVGAESWSGQPVMPLKIAVRSAGQRCSARRSRSMPSRIWSSAP